MYTILEQGGEKIDNIARVILPEKRAQVVSYYCSTCHVQQYMPVYSKQASVSALCPNCGDFNEVTLLNDPIVTRTYNHILNNHDCADPMAFSAEDIAEQFSIENKEAVFALHLLYINRYVHGRDVKGTNYYAL